MECDDCDVDVIQELDRLRCSSSTDPQVYVEIIRQLQKQLEEERDKFHRCDKLLAKYVKMYETTKRKLLSERRKKADAAEIKLKASLEKLLNKDQLDSMVRGTTKGSPWSDATLVKSLQLQFSCGSSGYGELRTQGYPIPAPSTLRENIQGIELNEGIYEEMFELMEQKVATFTDDRMRDCELAFEEIKLEEGQQFDSATKSYVGKSSFPTPGDKGKYVDAANGLTFALGGIFARWKLVVGHYYTPKSMDGRKLKPIVDYIIKRAEGIGLRVHVVSSDMGSVNQALWSEYKVCIAGRYSTIVNSIEHPEDENRRLWFNCDAGHLLKNIKNCLINNETIELTPDFVASNNLSSPVVRKSHVQTLATIQEGQELKFAKKVNSALLQKNSAFGKMKVCSAKHFLSREVAATLKLFAITEGKADMNTSATFFEVVSKWFTIITSRHRSVALGKTEGNEFSQNKFDETVEFLEDVIELFINMKVKGQWDFKPIQRGVAIASKTYIELSTYLIKERKYTYVLGGRLTTDFIENIYSCVRADFPIPNALQFKQSLKKIALSRYLKSVKTSSYEEDDRQLFSPSLAEFKQAFARHRHSKPQGMK